MAATVKRVKRAKPKDSIEIRRKIACARYGHPRIVTSCLGYLSCARCSQQIGDMLGGASTGTNKVMLGHGPNCAECRETARTLTPLEFRLLPRDVRQEVDLLLASP